MENKELCFNVIDYCCSESGNKLSHYDKMKLHSELLEFLKIDSSIDSFALANHVFVKKGWDRFHKVRQIAIIMGLGSKFR